VKGSLLGISLMISLIVSLMLVAREGATSPDSSSPKIYVNPRVSSKAPSENFTVDVVMASITTNKSLYAWEFDMSFNSTILNVTSIMQGPFLKTLGDTSWNMAPPLIDNKEGTVVATEAFISFPPKGATGSGVLANITFQVLDEGETQLHFYKTGLRTYNGTDILPIDHTTVDGFFAYPLVRDVAVTDVTAFPTSVKAGEPVSINVTAENLGEIEETFDVTVLYNSTKIETKTLTDLAPDGSETLEFSWDTKDVAEGNYKITAVASELSGETDTADNTYTNGFVTVTVPSSVFPIELIIAIVAVVIVVAIICGAVFLRRRRKPLKP
jgi:hypothetical protein